MPTPLDELHQRVDGKRPPPPIAALIGFTLSAVSPGETVIELAAGRQHANPLGVLHGGPLCDIADAAMGTSTLAEGETFATVELKINFLKPVGTTSSGQSDGSSSVGRPWTSPSATSPTSNRPSWRERRRRA